MRIKTTTVLNILLVLILVALCGIMSMIMGWGQDEDKNRAVVYTDQVTEDPHWVPIASWTTPKTTPIKNRRVYVISKLPPSWAVASQVQWIDKYTGSRWQMARSCPAGAYRCITLRAGNLNAPSIAETYNYNGGRVSIVVDLPYAGKTARSAAKRKYVLRHELGHAAGLHGHAGSCSNFMYRTTKCAGYGVTASQKRVMSAR